MSKRNRIGYEGVIALTLWIKEHAHSDENQLLSDTYEELAAKANASDALPINFYCARQVKDVCDSIGLVAPTAQAAGFKEFAAEINLKLAEINRRLEELEETVTQGAML